MWHGEVTRRIEPTDDELEGLKPTDTEPGFSSSNPRGFTYRPGIKTFPLRQIDLPVHARLVEFENIQIVRLKSDLGSTYLYWSLSLRVEMFGPRQDEPKDLKPGGKGWSVSYLWSDIDSIEVVRNKGYDPPHDIVNAHLNEAYPKREFSGNVSPRVGHPQQIIDKMASAPIPTEITRAFGYAASQHDEHCWWNQLDNIWELGPVEVVLPV